MKQPDSKVTTQFHLMTMSRIHRTRPKFHNAHLLRKSTNFALHSYKVQTNKLKKIVKSFLGYSVMYSWIRRSFQRCILPPPSEWFITLMMVAVHNSKTSVYSEPTWCYSPEDSHLHACWSENLKSHMINLYLSWFLFWIKTTGNSDFRH
jgi:hypothetical protein